MLGGARDPGAGVGHAAGDPGGALPGGDDRATSVPVTVWDPPAWVESLEPGDAVVVVGKLRRRFYQRPGGVGSRVDVEAELIGRATAIAAGIDAARAQGRPKPRLDATRFAAPVPGPRGPVGTIDRQTNGRAPCCTFILSPTQRSEGRDR